MNNDIDLLSLPVVKGVKINKERMAPDIRKNMIALIISYLGSVNLGVSVIVITSTKKKGFLNVIS